jgi:hypothetical protein
MGRRAINATQRSYSPGTRRLAPCSSRAYHLPLFFVWNQTVDIRNLDTYTTMIESSTGTPAAPRRTRTNNQVIRGDRSPHLTVRISLYFFSFQNRGILGSTLK